MEKKDNGYLIGTVGAIIGGLIGTIPWVLCYVYAEMMYSVLAILIGIGAFKGYELLKGKMGKPVPIIVVVVSVACVTLATLVVIPHLLLINEYGKTSMETFKALYAFDEFKTAIIQDYIYSLLFTGLGISGVIANIRRGIKNGDQKIDLMAPAFTPSDEEISAVKKIFEKRNAMDKNTVIPKDEVMDAVKDRESVFKFLVSRGIIGKKNGGYYYNTEVEQNPGKRAVKIILLTFGITFGVIALIALIGIMLG